MKTGAAGALALACAALLVAAGCSGGAAGDYDDAGGPTPTPQPTASPTATPDEGDDEVFTVAPVSAADFVFVANPENDDVARIETATRAVDVLPVGNYPLDLRVAPDGSQLATFNALSHDVSVVALPDPVETRLPVREVANRLHTSPLATHGVAVYDPARAGTGGPSASQNPGEVSVVDLVARTVTSSVMGFQPRGVAFAADDTRAFVLSDGLIASIDLTQPSKPKTLIPLVADPTTAPPAQEIQVSPDGTSALVLSATGLTLVDLVSGTRTPLSVGAAGTTATDLELTHDGRYYVVASLGTSGSFVDVFDRQNAFARTAVSIPGPAGSMETAPDADELYVFSRSAADERIWRVALNSAPGGPSPVLTEYSLVKPVRSVFIAPDGGGVVILHRFEDVADGVPSGESAYAEDDVMTVLDVDAGGGVPLLSAVALPGPPDAVAVTSDGAWAFAQIPASGHALVIDLASLLVDPVSLSSTPLFVGAVDGAHTGYVLQKHPLGRLTFIEPATLDVATVTGFEINAEIE